MCNIISMAKSIELSRGEIKNLKNYIRKNKLKKIPVKSNYESIRIDDSGLKLILYNSGKLVYNEDEKAEEILDSILTKSKHCFTLGTDEAGKGEWYGPLVVYCVALEPEHVRELRKLGVRDSKGIPKKRLMELAEKILEFDFPRESIVLMPEIYNRKYDEFKSEGKSLNDLLAWAHARLIKNVLKELKYEKAKVIIDRFDFKKTEFRLGDLDRKGLEIIQKPRAESEVPVAVASILAKREFENRVEKLNKRFNIDLRKSKPEEIPTEILPQVAKLHFKNVPEI